MSGATPIVASAGQKNLICSSQVEPLCFSGSLSGKLGAITDTLIVQGSKMRLHASPLCCIYKVVVPDGHMGGADDHLLGPAGSQQYCCVFTPTSNQCVLAHEKALFNIFFQTSKTSSGFSPPMDHLAVIGSSCLFEKMVLVISSYTVHWVVWDLCHMHSFVFTLPSPHCPVPVQMTQWPSSWDAGIHTTMTSLPMISGLNCQQHPTMDRLEALARGGNTLT